MFYQENGEEKNGVKKRKMVKVKTIVKPFKKDK